MNPWQKLLVFILQCRNLMINSVKQELCGILLVENQEVLGLLHLA
jgi:hypothetical protein